MEPQNLADRLVAQGRTVATDIADKAENVAADLAGNFIETGNISVTGALDSIAGDVKEQVGAVLNVADQVNNLADNIASSITNPLSSIASAFAPLGLESTNGKLPNPLEVFASYNYIFCLGCLTDYELHFPDMTYRKKEPLITILRSGGGDTFGSKTIFETAGKIEYYIDDVEIETIIAPNNNTRGTNATSLSFKIIEPYSMGLFLQALQIAAKLAGHDNYIDAPFLLSCEFRGWDDYGRPVNSYNSRRLFPLKLTNVEFEVTEGGSVYAVSAIPYQETALTDETQTTKVDTTFTGRTVGEMLQSGAQSLTSILNAREIEKVEAKQKVVPDQYIITFPKFDSSTEEIEAMGLKPEENEGATINEKRELSQERIAQLYKSSGGSSNKVPADFESEVENLKGVSVKGSKIGETIRSYYEVDSNINDIGKAKIVKNNLDSGQMPNAKHRDAENPEAPGEVDRCRVQRTGELRQMRFTSGKKIQKMIEEVVVASEFGRSIVDKKPDKNGMIDWFRIQTQVFNIANSANTAQTGRSGKVFVYRVVPFKVHKSRFNAATEASPGIEELKTQAVKEYNYIYTGKNKDVLNFDINFNAAFFTAIAGDSGQLSRDSAEGAAGQVAGGDKKAVTSPSEGTEEDSDPKVVGDKAQGSSTTRSGGHGLMVHPENQVARDFNEALVNSPVDLISVNLEIMGDPYYIADSGMGNYNATTLPNILNINADGAMEYQNGEVDIVLNFRTPIDYGQEYMEFPGLGTQPVGKFSGLYQVLFVTNKFSAGQFTQSLQTIRRPKQPTDTDIEPTSESSGALNTNNPEAQIASTPGFPKPGDVQGAINDIGGALQDIEGDLQNAASEIASNVQRSLPDLDKTLSDVKRTARNILSRRNV